MYNISLIHCFVIWCLHTNKRRPCSSLSGHPSSSLSYFRKCPAMFSPWNCGDNNLMELKCWKWGSLILSHWQMMILHDFDGLRWWVRIELFLFADVVFDGYPETKSWHSAWFIHETWYWPLVLDRFGSHRALQTQRSKDLGTSFWQISWSMLYQFWFITKLHIFDHKYVWHILAVDFSDCWKPHLPTFGI